MVVIHGKHAVEVGILFVAEESVGCIGAECRNLAVDGFLDCGDYHFLLFLAQQTAVASMRIECKHRYAWANHAEIALKRVVERHDFFINGLLGDGAADARHWQVGGDKRHAHFLAEEYHQCLVAVAYAGFEILGVAGETKFRTLDIFLTDRCCHYRVDITVLQVGDSSLKSQKCGTASLLVGFAHFHFNVFLNHFHQIWQMVLQLCGRFSDIDLICLHIYSLAVIGENFARPINHRSAKLLHCRVCESFQNHFAANSIGVPLGNANAYFLFVCH